MYQWHGSRYWGGAHGLAGIMHTLMHFPLNKKDEEDVKGTLRYMIARRFPSGNYPSSEGNATDRLVHWCHGAPGIAMTLCKASKVCLLSSSEAVYYWFCISEPCHIPSSETIVSVLNLPPTLLQ